MIERILGVFRHVTRSPEEQETEEEQTQPFVYEQILLSANVPVGKHLRELYPGFLRCAYCAMPVSMAYDIELCPHHHERDNDDWPVENRIYCDFLHRKKIPPRLSEEERNSDAEEFARCFSDEEFLRNFPE